MYQFSKTSLNNLEECHPYLRELAHKVMALQLFDFGISCGHREEKVQNDLYERGISQVRWPNSKHNMEPSRAMDIIVWIDGKVDWQKKESWYMAIGVFRGVAAMMGISLRVGADWDGDFNIRDQNFHDLGHIEIGNS